MRKLTTLEYIEKSNIKHNFRYDYSLVNYNGRCDKIKIICKTHGVFEQNAKNHLSGNNCPECSNLKRINMDIFIERSNKIHNNKFDYSLVKKYSKDKIKIICPQHGIFEQSPNKHMNGDGCSSCSGNKKLNNNIFIERAINIHHNRYDYSLVEYDGFDNKVKIICKIHGIFEQSPNIHLSGSGCPKCNGGSRKTTKYFIEECKNIHNDKYDYSLTNYINTKTNVKIICSRHGVFEQLPKHHLNGSCCPSCKESKGEKIINEYLIKNNYYFFRQKKFENCKNIYSLPFDFYLPKQNMCIEFDGEQHYRQIEFFGGDKSFDLRKKKDKIKTNFCKNKKIKLLRIKYNENIENKLKEYGLGL